jgi:hypothetical protein
VPGPSAEDVARSLACEGIEAAHKALPAGRRTPGELYLDTADLWSRRSRRSMRHQHRHGRVRQDVAGRPAEDHLAQAALGVGVRLNVPRQMTIPWRCDADRDEGSPRIQSCPSGVARPPIIRAAQGHRKPADLRQTQIRTIENFKLFRTLAADPASGNS